MEQDYYARNPRQGATVAEDKKIPSILFGELIEPALLMSRSNINSSREWKPIQQNKSERYQFLEKVPSGNDALSEGLPELTIDFKRYFTIPAEIVYSQLSSVAFHKSAGINNDIPRMNKAHRRCVMLSPYLEQVSSRFCYFQSRIALPAEHQSDP